MVFGGTSAASPASAGFTAVYNQYAAANGKPNLGFANPTLYMTASHTQPYAAFHDVTAGNNLYYAATSGWDYATGLGSVDAYNFARDLAHGAAGAFRLHGDEVFELGRLLEVRDDQFYVGRNVFRDLAGYFDCAGADWQPTAINAAR